VKKLDIFDTNLLGKRVLTRVDFNVPIDAEGRIADDTRIRASLPTIEALVEQGAKVILMSHLGRPKGKRATEYSLRPVAARLAELLGREVPFAEDCIGDAAKMNVDAMEPGDLLLLENLRFHPGEEANDEDFAAALAKLGDVFVNDAFGSAHRAHASTEGVTRFLSPALCGLLMKKELEYLTQVIEAPVHPFTAILGGAKISGKIDVIQNLMGKVDTLLIGGGMMFTFLKAKGLEIGKSLLEKDRVEIAARLLRVAEEQGKRLLLPIDVVVAKTIVEDTEHETVPVDAIPPDMLGLDIGPKSVALFSKHIKESNTVLWNGPMGVFEIPAFANGTFAIASALAEATRNGAVTVVGGGDSAAAIMKAGREDDISHISTGGGASLELLEGKALPGVVALTDRP